jgi:hypothetical protein
MFKTHYSSKHILTQYMCEKITSAAARRARQQRRVAPLTSICLGMSRVKALLLVVCIFIKRCDYLISRHSTLDMQAERQINFLRSDRCRLRSANATPNLTAHSTSNRAIRPSSALLDNKNNKI